MDNTKQACLNLSVLKAGGQPHILFFGIGPVIDDLRCGLCIYCPVPTAATKVRYSAAEERTIETSLPDFFLPLMPSPFCLSNGKPSV